MEPTVRIFLITIVQSISWALLWMLTNTYFGIKLGLLFLDEEITVWHWIYYAAMIASFVWVFRHIMAKWKHVPKFGRFEEDLPE